MTKSLWVTGMTYIMDSSLCVLKGLVGMLYIGIYGSLLVKKFRNWKIGIHRYEINARFFFNKKRITSSQDIGTVFTFDIFVVKYKKYNIIMVSTKSGLVVCEGKK